MKTLKENLVQWLMAEYTKDVAQEQIENAEVARIDNTVTITYDNGVVDVVRIDENLNILEQLK